MSFNDEIAEIRSLISQAIDEIISEQGDEACEILDSAIMRLDSITDSMLPSDITDDDLEGYIDEDAY